MDNIREQGEYELGPELPPGPRPLVVRPIRMATLECEYKDGSARGVSLVSQYIAGMAYPFVFWGLFAAIFGRAGHFIPLLWVGVVIFSAIVVYTRVRLQWTAFIPGLLITLLGLPLLAVLTCGALIAIVSA